ncbi:MAG TPA: sigma-54 dependent transcriptional regulator, partial [Myxococcota bacterium]|nr:sigma-54 dependent transcriptional regulator [Myxococcota bacterium]
MSERGGGARAGEILVVDDQDEIRSYVLELFAEHGRQVRGFADGEAALAHLRAAPQSVALVVLDLDLGPGRRGGMQVLPEVKAIDPGLPVIILTGTGGSLDVAVAAIRAGADDFLEKDHHLGQRVELSIEKVERILGAARDTVRARQELEREATLRREDHERRYRIVGRSAAIMDVVRRVERVAAIPRPVLVMGERGTGKELVAGAIHHASPRASKPFIVLNVAAVPETLLDSELFGHEKGAFTDARERKAGRFELADGGTLFLDEVGNMPMEFQRKILRVLEYPRFERAGGTTPITVDVRVIAATNAHLEAAMERGDFRRDLYDRLAFEVVRLPLLRERMEDVPVLADHFLRRFLAEVPGLRARRLGEDAIAALMGYVFPGNVRELKAIVERAAYLCEGDDIRAKDLGLGERHPRFAASEPPPAAAASGAVAAA